MKPIWLYDQGQTWKNGLFFKGSLSPVWYMVSWWTQECVNSVPTCVKQVIAAEEGHIVYLAFFKDVESCKVYYM